MTLERIVGISTVVNSYKSCRSTVLYSFIKIILGNFVIVEIIGAACINTLILLLALGFELERHHQSRGNIRAARSASLQNKGCHTAKSLSKSAGEALCCYAAFAQLIHQRSCLL